MMGHVGSPYLGAKWLSCWLAGLATAQTSTMFSSNADGLMATAGPASATGGTVLVGGTSSAYRVIETLPAEIDETPPLLPNINDPDAVNAQDVCSG